MKPGTGTAGWRATLGNLATLAMLLAAAAAFLPLHDGHWWPASPRPRHWWQAGAWCLAYAALCAWCLRRREHAHAAAALPAAGTPLPWLVAHASQTGFASELAQHTADALRASGAGVSLCAIAEVDAALLARCERVLFIASTTGEGDPPDPALAFVRDVLPATPDLSRLQYAVLALGDRSYGHFCRFGHQLDQWLARSGAREMFDLIEVDAGEPGALRHWQHHLAQAAGAASMPDWTPPQYQAWTLGARRLLNPGSLGGPAFHLSLRPPAATPVHWQAGDIAEVGPRNAPAAVEAVLASLGLQGDTPVVFAATTMTLRDALSRARLPSADFSGDARSLVETLEPLPHREYSIASLPADGRLELLVRLMHQADGRPGLGSGWLCLHTEPGDEVDLRIRSNPNFHAPGDARPLLLVGNGTGIAGLRAVLKARIAAGHRRNWLLFGERQRACDAFFAEEIAQWREAGLLERVDLAYSREPDAHRYVQDALRAAAPALRDWIDAGASLHVCGSLEGMAPGVDAVLRETLGAETVEALRAAGRYRRDVY